MFSLFDYLDEFVLQEQNMSSNQKILYWACKCNSVITVSYNCILKKLSNLISLKRKKKE